MDSLLLSKSSMSLQIGRIPSPSKPSMSLQIGRIPSLSKSKPSISLSTGLRRMATVSLTKPLVEKARDDYLTIAKHVIAASDNHTKNVVVSPVSIRVALCVCAAASSGSTRAQLLAYLKPEGDSPFDPFYFHIIHTILVDGFHLGGPLLSTKGGVWPDWSHYLKPAFRDIVHNPMDLSPRMVYATAVCFRATWSEKFDENLTTDHDFHLLTSTAVRVPFMTNVCKQRVGAFDGFKVLKLPYVAGVDKRRFSMYIYLPDAKDGVPYLIERICSELGFVDRHLPHEEAVALDEFRIPKFKVAFELEASEVLRELGVVDLFERGMAEIVGESLLGEIVHRAIVVVNEEGTEAEGEGEGEAVSVGLGSVMDKKAGAGLRFVADHPFVFTIREDTSGVVLFIGQLIDPLADASFSFGFIQNPVQI